MSALSCASPWPNERRSQGAWRLVTPSVPSPRPWVARLRRCAGRSTPTAGGRSTGPWWPTGRRVGGRCDPSGPSSRSAGGSEGSSSASSRPSGHPSRSRRGWLGVPRSPGDAGVPRDHLPVTLRPEPWSAAQRAPFVSAQRSGHASGQGLRQGQPRRAGQAQEHGDDLGAPGRGEGPCGARATGRAT